MGLLSDSISLVLDATGVQQAARTFQNLASTQVGLGSSGGQAAFLQMLGGFAGADPVGMARSAYQRSMSGFGIMANARAGNSLQFNELQPVNYGERLVNLTRKLVDIGEKQGYGAAQVFATQAGIEEELKLLLLDKPQRDRLMKILEQQGNQFNRLSRAQAARDASISEMRYHFNELVAPPTAAFLKWLSEPAKTFNGLPLGPQPGSHAWNQAQHPQQAQHTQALNSLNNTLRSYSGLYGGGQRARAAMGAFGTPGSFSIPNVNQIWRSATFRLGAYSIGM